jgi:hypothetical protein
MVTIAIFLAAFAILPYKLGFERFFESLAYFSATWLVMFIFGPAIAFFAWLAFPPRGSMPRLEISRSRIRVVPGRIARLFAETAVEIDLSPKSRDILLCHSVWQGLGDGLRLVVRDGDGTEREIRATSMDYLSARKAQKLAEGISAATGLPVHLLIRRRPARWAGSGNLMESAIRMDGSSSRGCGGNWNLAFCRWSNCGGTVAIACSNAGGRPGSVA